jgi:hypothetical protein
MGKIVRLTRAKMGRDQQVRRALVLRFAESATSVATDFMHNARSLPDPGRQRLAVLYVGLGDGAAIGVGIDHHDLVAPAAVSTARSMEASSRLVGYQAAPPAEAGGTEAVEGLLKTAARR